MELVHLGKRVILAGLDTTFANEPFGPVPNLMALADEVTKLSAVCMTCGAPAIHTQRLGQSQELVVVGAAGLYEARCRTHFEPFIDEHHSEQLDLPAVQTGLPVEPRQAHLRIHKVWASCNVDSGQRAAGTNRSSQRGLFGLRPGLRRQVFPAGAQVLTDEQIAARKATVLTVKQCIAGDSAGLAATRPVAAPAHLRHLLPLHRLHTDAEDLTQDVFLKLYRISPASTPERQL